MKEYIERLLTDEAQKTNDCLCGGTPAQSTSATSIALLILASGKKVEDFKDEDEKPILYPEGSSFFLWSKCFKVHYVTEKLSVFLNL